MNKKIRKIMTDKKLKDLKRKNLQFRRSNRKMQCKSNLEPT
jgi:hypothetical protein